jgi:hypothetical protein
MAKKRNAKKAKPEMLREGDREYWRDVHGVLKAGVMILARREHKEEDCEAMRRHLEAIIVAANGWLVEMPK